MQIFCSLVVSAETFKDDEYHYRINVPEGSEMRHNPHERYNLTFSLPDTTATFFVYALDVGEIPRDEMASSDTKTVFRRDYISRLDREAFKLPATPVEEKEDFWIKRVERRYNLDDGAQAITVTYFENEYPHVVAVVGKDLDRPEVRSVIDSFKTEKFKFSGWAVWGSIAACLLAMGIGFLGGGGIDNKAVSSFFFYVFFLGGFAMLLLMIVLSFFDLYGKIWYLI